MLCAWVAVIGVPAAHAYNLCMSTPLASFDGFGWASPDGNTRLTHLHSEAH